MSNGQQLPPCESYFIVSAAIQEFAQLCKACITGAKSRPLLVSEYSTRTGVSG